MANKIQIKRSTTTAAPTGLANGELAYSANGGVLFIGSPADGSTLAIGGLRNPGVLTANQALVANATSGIDKVIVANLAPTAIWANGSIGTAGQILASNGSVVYWAPAPSGVTDLTESANATTVSIFSSTGTDVVIDGANSSTAGIMTAADKNKLDAIPAGAVAGSNSQVQFNANGVLSGDAGFTFDGVADTLILGGTGQTTSPLFRVANSTTSANLSSAALTIGTIVANTTGLFVGANVFANSSAFDVGNTVITSTNLTLGGQVTANGGVGTSGQVLTSGAAGNVYWTTPVDNDTTYDLLSVANTGANEGIVRLDPSSGANDDVKIIGLDDIVLSSNATAIYVDHADISRTDTTNGNTSPNYGGTFTAVDSVTTNARGHVTAVNVKTITMPASNNTTYDLLTIANTTNGVVRLNSSANANDDVVFTGSNGITLTSNGTGGVTVTLNNSLSLTDLTLSGNLDVNGTLTTVDTTNLSVTDSIISLARGQTTANTLDIGFYGTYGNATVTSYTGLFRDATDSKYKLFAGAIPEPTTTVDTANVNYAGATLVVQALEGASATAFVDNFILDGGTF